MQSSSWTLATLFIIGAVLFLTLPAAATPDKPNIVLILIDDLGWKDAGYAGSTYYQTPHIDRLAADGMTFLQGYSCAPVCSPSRGALLSGKYPARTKLTNVWQDGPEDYLPDMEDRLFKVAKENVEEKLAIRGNSQTLEALHRRVLPKAEYTFGEALRDAGYATGYLGKWHIGWQEAYQPQNQGFTFVEGTRSKPSRGHFGRSFEGLVRGLKGLKPDDYIADALTGAAVRFINANREKPFLLVLSHYAVHTPIQAKEEYIELCKKVPTSDHYRSDYAAMIKSVDDSVGHLTETLRQLGLEDNTLLIFTSDNGGLTPITSNFPLLGGKSLGYEAGMRVPFLIKWPAKVKPGTKSRTRVTHVDLYPTMLEAAGVEKNPRQHLDGVSLMPALTGQGNLPERAVFFHYPHFTGYTGPFSSVIYKDWKLLRYYNDADGAHQLFDLRNDPYELHDLAAALPDKIAELSAMLDNLLIETGAELPRPNPRYDPAKPSMVTKYFPYSLAIRHRAESEERVQESFFRTPKRQD